MTDGELVLKKMNLAIGGNDPRRKEDTVISLLQAILCGGIGSGTPTSFFSLLEVELVDDVAGDGTGLILPYSELYAVLIDGTRTLIATVDEKGATYVLQGTRRNRNEIGVPGRTATNQLVINGSSWSPTETMTQFSYAVINVDNTVTPPTFTDSNGVTTPLFSGESVEYSLIPGSDKFKVAGVSITANAGDIIKIIFTEITI